MKDLNSDNDCAAFMYAESINQAYARNTEMNVVRM